MKRLLELISSTQDFPFDSDLFSLKVTKKIQNYRNEMKEVKFVNL